MTDPDSKPEFGPWAAVRRGKLLRIAVSVLKDPAEAEDVVQDTMIAVWRMTERGEIKNIDAYAARSVWVNAIKQRSKRRKTVSLEERNRYRAEPSGCDPSEDTRLTAWEVERAINSLPTAQQIVIRLRYYGGMSFREIGKSLSISINTAASRYRYALKALRLALSAIQKELHHGK